MTEQTDKKNIIPAYGRLVFKLAVALACLWYIIKCGRGIKPADIKLIFIPTVLAGSLFYFAATFIMVYGWRENLIMLSGEKKPFQLMAKIYFSSVLAKYLPSNLLHFAARHIQCIQAGYQHAPVALSNILENIFILIAAVILICTGLTLGLIAFPSDLIARYCRAELIMAAGLIITVGCLLLLRKNKPVIRSSRLALTLALLRIITGYVIFLLLTGSLFFCVMDIAISDPLTSCRARIIFIYICAWTIGLIVPGAPGGLGVREAVIIYLMADLTTSDQALLGALLFRLITVTGEILGHTCAKLYLK